MQRKAKRAIPAKKKPKAAAKKAPTKVSAKAAASAAADGRRTELVLAAYHLIADRGLEELRTREIAAKVGINISTLHYYFSTKEELIDAVGDYIGGLFRTVREALPATATPLQELRHVFATQIYRRRVEPKLEVVMQEMMLRARRDEKVRVRLEQMLLNWNGYIQDMLERGIERGEISPKVDPKLAAGIITSYSIGTNLQSGVRPNSFPLEATSENLIRWLLPK
jgi:AcrR family transcriptional regulator